MPKPPPTSQALTDPITPEWRKSGGYVCRLCGGPAYYHPLTNWVWGCLACGYTTTSVYVYFARSEEDISRG